MTGLVGSSSGLHQQCVCSSSLHAGACVFVECIIMFDLSRQRVGPHGSVYPWCGGAWCACQLAFSSPLFQRCHVRVWPTPPVAVPTLVQLVRGVGQRSAQSQFSSWCNVLHRQAGAGGMQLTSAISCASGMVCVFPACVIACDVCSCCMLALCTLQNGWRMCYSGGGGGVGLDTLPGSWPDRPGVQEFWIDRTPCNQTMMMMALVTNCFWQQHVCW